MYISMTELKTKTWYGVTESFYTFCKHSLNFQKIFYEASCFVTLYYFYKRFHMSRLHGSLFSMFKHIKRDMRARMYTRICACVHVRARGFNIYADGRLESM